MKFWYTATLTLAIALGASLSVNVPETSWETETIAEDVDRRFMAVETTENNVNIVYRNSSNGGVFLNTKTVESSILDTLKSSTGRNTEIVDDEAGTGAYISTANIDGELGITYQDSTVGDERVIFASETGAEWEADTVDNVGGGGINVGMYTSLTSFRGEPLALYHSPVEGLIASQKQDDEWVKRNIEEGVGWFTATTSCGDRAYAVSRARDSEDLIMAEFDGEWRTEALNRSAKSSVSIDEVGCQPHTTYLSSNEELVYRSPELGEETVAETDYSDSSIHVDGKNTHISYYDYGEGLFYAEKTENGWEKTKLGNSTDTNRYNDIDIDNAGNIHVVFSQGYDIVHAEYNTKRAENMKVLVNLGRGTLLILLLVFVTQIYRKTGFEQLKSFVSRS